MTRRKAGVIVLAAVSAFVVSSLWYSPFLFGKQFFALSGVTVGRTPAGLNILVEMLRNLLLAFVTGELLARQKSTALGATLTFAAMLWVGFPFDLLSGSVLWQNVAPELALIHCGDWALKILLMTFIPWIANRRAATRNFLNAVPAVQQR